MRGARPRRDAKVPWKLSRCQHLTALGRARVIERDPRLPAEFEAEIRSWIRHNTVGLSVNWASTMDVALRAVICIWALGLFEDSPFSEAFREENPPLAVRARPLDPATPGSR